MKFIVLIRIIVISILITISSCSSGDISKFDKEVIFSNDSTDYEKVKLRHIKDEKNINSMYWKFLQISNGRWEF